MKTLSLFLLLSGAPWFPAQAQTDSTAKSYSEKEIFTVVEQHPEFPGGPRKLAAYLMENLHYPEEARKARLKGRLFVNFVVTDEGRIEQVKALNKLGMGLDEEAVRVVASMPNWIPGKQAGRPVNVSYNLPINFHLN